MSETRAMRKGSAARIAVLSILLGASAVGCVSGDRPITTGDEATVSSALSALTAPAGYERVTCDISQSSCFTSDALLPAPLSKSTQTLLQHFGLVVRDKDVTCSSAVTTASSIAECSVVGRIDDVQVAVTLSSTHQPGTALPQGTRVTFTPSRIGS